MIIDDCDTNRTLPSWEQIRKTHNRLMDILMTDRKGCDL